MVVDSVSAKPWREELETCVRSLLKRESTGHDAYHAFRVRDLALRLAAAVGADGDIVEAAALLHDVGHCSGRERHAQAGVELAGPALAETTFPTDKRAAVLDCIAHHEWEPDRRGDPEDPSLEFMVVADADRLDALGAIGIARTFAFGGAHGRPIWTPEDEAGRSTIGHFHEKLLRLQEHMYTEPARLWARQRVDLLKDFLEAFFLECGDDTIRLSGLNGKLGEVAAMEPVTDSLVE